MPPPWEPAAKPARSHGGLEAFGSHTSHSLDGGIAYKPLTRGWVPFTRSGWVLFTLSKRAGLAPGGQYCYKAQAADDYSNIPHVLGPNHTHSEDYGAESNVVCATTPFPQPANFNASPNVIAQGDWYTISAGGASNMTLDIQYTFNGGGPYPIYGWPSLDSGGNASISTDQYTAIGDYAFTKMKNTLNTSPSYWMDIYETISVGPPPAPAISAAPSNVQQGQCYIIYANALMEGVALDIQYTFNGGGAIPIYGWPYIGAGGQSGDICTSSATAPGVYVFVEARNPAEGSWTSTYSPVTVTPAP